MKFIKIARSKYMFNSSSKEIKTEISNIYLHFYPTNSPPIIFSVVHHMKKFGSNQTLVSSNLKCFNSATILLEIFIIPMFNFYKCFLTRVEVHLDDSCFFIVNNHFYFGDLFVWVKYVTPLDYN